MCKCLTFGEEVCDERGRCQESFSLQGAESTLEPVVLLGPSEEKGLIIKIYTLSAGRLNSVITSSG